MNNQIQFSSFFLQTKNWLFPFLIILSGCDLEEGENKPCPTGPFPYYTFSDEFKRYCVFPDSSYWIYRDSISGDLDSLIILNQELKEKQLWDFCELSYYEDNYEFYLYSSLTDKITDKGGMVNFVNSAKKDALDVGEIYGMLGYIPGYYGKLKLGEKIGSSPYIFYEKYYDSIKFNKTYKKVKIFKVQDNVREIKRGSRSFWAENVGIIRMEAFGTDDTLILNLERYKIKQ